MVGMALPISNDGGAAEHPECQIHTVTCFFFFLASLHTSGGEFNIREYLLSPSLFFSFFATHPLIL